MERISQIIRVDSPLVFLRYQLTLDTMVQAWAYDYTEQRDLYELERVPLFNMNVGEGQFAVDDEHSAIYLNPAALGTYIRVSYYSDGEINPFFATSDLYLFVSKVLKWTSNRLVDGFFFYREECDRETELYRLAPGSFVYNGQFYAFAGIDFRITDYAPPTVVGQCRGYLFYIDQDVINSHMDRQIKALLNVGLLRSSGTYATFGEAKLDVEAQLAEVSEYHRIIIAYMYVVMNESHNYETWIDYPPEHRTL